MATYYVDSTAGLAENNGLSVQTPVDTFRRLTILPGDTVLIKAGSVFRDCLDSPNGEEGKVITWDMYGEGEKPQFLGSDNLHDASKWKETDKNIWAWQGDFETQVCNLIFDHDKSCGVLAWEYEDLNEQGKWHYTHMGYGEANFPAHLADRPKVLYLYSVGNPAEVYSDIECAVYRHRCLLRGQKHIRIANMSCKYSGVHAYGQSFVEDIVIRDCEFRFIGGCVWDRIQRIRFGNGIEIWEHGKDFTLEHCYFDQVYDSCTTHQGFKNENPCERINIINNIFKNYGMAAYELRDRIALDTHFDATSASVRDSASRSRAKRRRASPNCGRSRWDTICSSGASMRRPRTAASPFIIMSSTKHPTVPRSIRRSTKKRKSSSISQTTSTTRPRTRILCVSAAKTTERTNSPPISMTWGQTAAAVSRICFRE